MYLHCSFITFHEGNLVYLIQICRQFFLRVNLITVHDFVFYPWLADEIIKEADLLLSLFIPFFMNNYRL